MDDIIKGEWEPRSLGEAIDLLIIRNIRMWHLQEQVYHLEALEAQDREGLVAYLKDATWMNLQRNHAMDRLDAGLVGALFSEYQPGAAAPGNPGPRIWEPTLDPEA